MSKYFGTGERADGTTFVMVAADAPEWVGEVVFAAHDDEMPNDWRYEMCEAIFAAIENGDMVGPWDTAVYELADSLCDIYSHDLLMWVAGNLRRAGDVDEACDELGRPEGLIETIRQGQQLVIERMAWKIVEACEAQVPA